MKIDKCIALDLPQDKRVSRVKAASFHPIQNKIAIGFRRDIYEYDLVTGSRVAQYTTESEITHLAHAHTHNVLIAALKNGCFSALDLTSHTLTAFHVPIRSTEKRSVSYFAVSRTRPFIFYVRDRALSVCGIEMFADSKNRVEYSHKKAISCISSHPSRNLMASASIDGNVRIWDTASHALVAAFDETGEKLWKSPVTSLCFYSSREKSSSLSSLSNNSRHSLSTSSSMNSLSSSSRGSVANGLPSLSSSSTANAAAANGRGGGGGGGLGPELLITGTKSGRVQVWYITPSEQRVLATINLQEWIVDIFFHATLPCLMALNHKGCLKAINIGHLITNFNAGNVPSMKGILTRFDMIDTFYAPLHDTSYMTTQKHLQSLVPPISARMNENSGVLVFCGKNYQVANLNTPNVHGIIVSEYFPVFNTVDDSDFPVSAMPQSSTLPFTLDMVLNQSSPPSSSSSPSSSSHDDLEFEVPVPDLFYIDTFTATPHDILMKYNIATNTSAKVQLLKINSPMSEFYRCVEVKSRTGLSKTNQNLLVFYEKQRIQSSYNTDNRTRFFMPIDLSKKSELPLEPGKDGDFLEANNPNNKQFYILDESGVTIRVYDFGNSTPIRTVKLPVKISRVFSCPFRKNTSLYYSRAHSLIGFANDDLTFALNKQPSFDLRQREVPVSVQWQPVYQSESGDFLIALLTTHRVLILDQHLKIRACVESPDQSRSSLYFHSCLWLGNVLLYNTCSAVYCLCPNMLEQTMGAQSQYALCTLEHANSVLSGVLYDRIFFTCYRNNCPQMSVRYVNIVEPLILSIISLETSQENKLKMMQSILGKFDCRSVSEPTLIALEKCGFADLASELIIHSVYDFSWEIRFRLALHSLQFEYAFEILRAQYQRTVIQDQVEATPTSPQDYDMNQRDSSTAHSMIKQYVSDEEYCMEKSSFHGHFVDLAQKSIEYAHYVIAAKCYDITNNSWALFKLFSMYAKELAVVPLSRLAMRCKNSPDLYTIYMACRVVLGDTYNEDEEDHIFNLFNGTFGKKRLSLELHTIDTIEWRKKKENIAKRSFDLGTSFKVNMKIKQEKKTSTDPTGLSNFSIENNSIEPLSMNNFSQWMGYNTTETKKLEQDWDRVDFSLSDFGTGANKGRGRSDSVSSNKTTPTKLPSLPSLPSISSLDLPTSASQAKIEDGMETERGNNEDNDETTTKDEDDFNEQPDLDKIRKQYMGGSSSEGSSDEDGEGDSYRKKRKLFRKLRIKDQSEVSTTATNKVDLSAFKLSGPGGLGIGGPSSSTSLSTASSGNARARRRGRTTTADVSSVLGSQTTDENTEVDSESATASDVQSESSTPLPAPQTTPPQPKVKHVTPPAPSTALVNPAESLKKGMALMEQAHYREAKQCVNDAIVCMINDNSEILKKTNLLLCVRYKLLIMMLANNQRIEGKAEPTMTRDLARNSFLLSQIKCIAKHQVICRNMACKRNMMAQNFGVAARSIRLLLPVTPPQHVNEMQQRLRQCEDQGLRNEDRELEEAIARAEQDISSETDQEFLPIKFCWRSFEIVKPQQALCACPYCDATFLPVEGYEEGQLCSYCYYGTLEARQSSS